MANVKLNPAFESIRGKVGDLVFKTFAGREIVASMPDFSGQVFTDAQKAAQEKFRKAAGYGEIVMADEQARKLYEQVAKSRKQPLFSLIMQDFLNDPHVDEVDLSAYSGQSGEKIFVRASDDFEVAAVHVAIAKESGEPIENGAAVKTAADPGRWMYTTTASAPPGTPVKIQVSVTDRPGHTVTKTETK
jgi:hypothetical protein